MTRYKEAPTQITHLNYCFVNHLCCILLSFPIYNYNLQFAFCSDCSEGFHILCLVPPLSRLPGADWSCGRCQKIQSTKRIQEILSRGDPATLKREKLEARARLSVFDDFFFFMEGLDEEDVLKEIKKEVNNISSEGVEKKESETNLADKDKDMRMEIDAEELDSSDDERDILPELKKKQAIKKQSISESEQDLKMSTDLAKNTTTSKSYEMDEEERKHLILSRLKEDPNIGIEIKQDTMECLSVFDDFLVMIPEAEHIDMQKLDELSEDFLSGRDIFSLNSSSFSYGQSSGSRLDIQKKVVT